MHQRHELQYADGAVRSPPLPRAVRCVQGGPTGVTSVARGEKIKGPIAPIAQPIAPERTGPPQIVPAAEQKPPSDK